MDNFDFAGKTVLVTGASSGIGAAFARELARSGSRLILVARSAARLEALAAELGAAHIIAIDLGAPGAAQRVFDEVSASRLEVDVLINNAGFGLHGVFGELPRATQREEIDLNVGALVELSHVFLPMIERRRGGLIQVASIAAFQPVPYMAVYGATKAFVLSFSEALAAECRPRGVRVLALNPGATDTSFFQRAGEAASSSRNRTPPEDVVRVGLAAFVAGRASVVPGTSNYLTTLISRFTSRELALSVAARMMKPKQPNRLRSGRSETPRV